MSKTLFDKLWDQHLIEEDGETSLLAIDRILLHERTGGVALQGLAEAGRKIALPQQVFVTMDHVVDTFPGRTDDTIMPTGKDFIQITRKQAMDAGVTLFDLGDIRQGIVHVISPEMGIVLPGLSLVCPDSHTCTQGAMGALAWGIGSTEAEHALATGTLRVKRPGTVRIWVDGELSADVTAKDLALYILQNLGSAAARSMAIEFAGPAISALGVEGRLTLCNMAAEMGAFTAIIAPDDKIFRYLENRTYAPKGELAAEALKNWQNLQSDADAKFDVEHHFDAGQVTPMITWGTSPEHALPMGSLVPETADDHKQPAYARARNYMDLSIGQPIADLKINAAFIGSCTNSRISDLRRAAEVIKGRQVAPHVKAICVPGSGQVKQQAEAEGLDMIFKNAGFEWREAGCSMCFFAGGESFGAQDRVISSTNRNFERRQGPGTRTHLASPDSVAASAILGRIASAAELPSLGKA